MEKLKKFAYREKLTSTKMNQMIDEIEGKMDKNLSNLSAEGEEKIKEITGIGDIDAALAAILGTEV